MAEEWSVDPGSIKAPDTDARTAGRARYRAVVNEDGSWDEVPTFLGVSDACEVRVVNEQTGGEKGSKLARFDLLPYDVLWQVAELYGAGARKYEDRNWEKGYAWSLSMAALMRHLTAFWQQGESVDEETGAHHLASVIFHASALMRFEREHPELDDRP